MKIIRKFLLAFILLSTTTCSYAKKIVVKTIPENARIEVDGSVVGEGSYTLKFDKGNEFYVVTVSAPDYITRTYRVLKSNPKNSVLFTLPEDEAKKASFGSEDGAALANSWMDITCKKGLTEDVIWKRLISVCTSYFDNIAVRDKSAGWIKTNWKITRFPHQVVRTRLEVRMSFTDEDVISYRARVTCHIRDIDCPSENCFVAWDRVLTKFEPMIQELQTTVGGGE